MALVRVYLLSLFLVAPVVVNGFRAKLGRLETDSNKSDSNASAKWSCNWFSSGKVKEYRFDIRTSGEDCKTGSCVALKLIRNVGDPALEINYGYSWAVRLVETEEGQDLEWKLARENEGIEAKQEVLKLHDVHEVLFHENNDDENLPDTLDIKWGDGDELRIKGGIFYDDDLVLRGLLKMAENATGDVDAENADKIGRDGVRDQGIVMHAEQWGHRIGGGVGVVGAGGFATAAAVAGVAVSNTALVGGAMAGILGGAVAGGVIGLAIGGAIGLAGAAGMFKLVHDHNLCAADKMWQKLWCLNGFKTCYKNVFIDAQATTLIVPRLKQCSEVRFTDTCNMVYGAKRRTSLPFPDCKCEEEKEEVWCKKMKKVGRKFHIGDAKAFQNCACSWGGPRCEEIDGAISTESVGWPHCKCESYDHKVKCGSEVVAERKFNAEDLFATWPACNPVCG